MVLGPTLLRSRHYVPTRTLYFLTCLKFTWTLNATAKGLASKSFPQSTNWKWSETCYPVLQMQAPPESMASSRVSPQPLTELSNAFLRVPFDKSTVGNDRNSISIYHPLPHRHERLSILPSDLQGVEMGIWRCLVAIWLVARHLWQHLSLPKLQDLRKKWPGLIFQCLMNLQHQVKTIHWIKVTNANGQLV